MASVIIRVISCVLFLAIAAGLITKGVLMIVPAAHIFADIGTYNDQVAAWYSDALPQVLEWSTLEFQNQTLQAEFTTVQPSGDTDGVTVKRALSVAFTGSFTLGHSHQYQLRNPQANATFTFYYYPSVSSETIYCSCPGYRCTCNYNVSNCPSFYNDYYVQTYSTCYNGYACGLCQHAFLPNPLCVGMNFAASRAWFDMAQQCHHNEAAPSDGHQVIILRDVRDPYYTVDSVTSGSWSFEQHGTKFRESILLFIAAVPCIVAAMCYSFCCYKCTCTCRRQKREQQQPSSSVLDGVVVTNYGSTLGSAATPTFGYVTLKEQPAPNVV